MDQGLKQRDANGNGLRIVIRDLDQLERKLQIIVGREVIADRQGIGSKLRIARGGSIRQKA